MLRSVISAFQLHFNQPGQPGPGLERGSAPWRVASIKISSLAAPPFNLSVLHRIVKPEKGAPWSTTGTKDTALASTATPYLTGKAGRLSLLYIGSKVIKKSLRRTIMSTALLVPTKRRWKALQSSGNGSTTANQDQSEQVSALSDG